MATPTSLPIAFKVLTVNVHKGFTTFNRRFMLHELREAVRGVAADLVFLQEVQGSHQRHAQRVANFPQVPHYEFLADTIWSQYAYGRNAVYDNGDHGNALLSKFPITHYENHDISIRGPERRGMLHCVLQPPGLINGFPADEPVVLAGDFNDWRHRAHAVLQREAGLQEVFVHAFGRAVRTFPASMPLLALDRIYVRKRRFCYDPPLLCTALCPLGAGQPLRVARERRGVLPPRVRCDCQRPA